jgi:hypothetical protein
MAPAANGYSDARHTVATVSAEFPTEDLDAFVQSLQNQLATLQRAFSSKIHVLETKCRELEAENKTLKQDKEKLTAAAARAAQPSMSKNYTFQLPLDDDVADPFKSNTQKPVVPSTSSSLQPTSAVFVPSKPVPPSTSTVHKAERGGAAYRGRGRGAGGGSRATSYTLVIPANMIKQQPMTVPIPVPASTSNSSNSSSDGASKPSNNGSPESGTVINGTTGPNTPAHKDSTGSSTARIEPLGTLSNNASFVSQNGASAQQSGEQQTEDKQHPPLMHIGYKPTRGRHSYRGRGGGRGPFAYQPWAGSAVNA